MVQFGIKIAAKRKWNQLVSRAGIHVFWNNGSSSGFIHCSFVNWWKKKKGHEHG